MKILRMRRNLFIRKKLDRSFLQALTAGKI